MKLRTENVVARELDGETVLLDMETSQYLTLNDTATFLVDPLRAGATEDELVALVLGEYDVTSETARTDVRTFLAGLRQVGLLVD